jgi:DNA replication protein DnaD
VHKIHHTQRTKKDTHRTTLFGLRIGFRANRVNNNNINNNNNNNNNNNEERERFVVVFWDSFFGGAGLLSFLVVEPLKCSPPFG